MSDDAPPVIPVELQQYNSYVVDPQWQRKFSYIWAGVAAAFILVALPRFIKSVRTGAIWSSITGITEDLYGRGYESLRTTSSRKKSSKEGETPAAGRFAGVRSVLKSVTLWMPPLVDLDVGQLAVIVGYFVVLLICITVQAPLMDNPNRAGFLAIAQLPVVFLLSTKNSILSLLLGPGNGYEKLNFLHRWSGRGLFLSAAIHGSLWIRNHLQYGLPILGPQKETSGVATFAMLCVIVLSSLKPVRAFAYQVFFVIHVLGFVSFFVVLCYHTPYATPYIFPPLAFYGFDMLLRMFRYRIKDATLTPCDKQMTIVHIKDSDGGWIAGQHVRLRVFFGARVFESHPLTILSAPPKHTCLRSKVLTLGARNVGDWSKALNEYALANAIIPTSSSCASMASQKGKEKELKLKDFEDGDNVHGVDVEVTEDLSWLSTTGAPVQVMIDGPYGGSSVDLGEYEHALLVAGGSGVTFTLGLLDDIIGRCVKLGRRGGEKTRRIEFVWCIRSFACIDWFAPMLMDICLLAATDPTLDLHVSIFVTCLCNPEKVPAIPNSDVLVDRPSITQLLKEFVRPRHHDQSDSDSTKEESLQGLEVVGGGVAVCAAGPEGLTREARNAVAGVAMTKGVQLGGVACHTEEYVI